VRTKAQISISRVATFYPLAPGLGKGTWQMRSFAVWDQAYRPGQPLATSAIALSDPMLAWCELQDPCQLQVARFQRKVRAFTSTKYRASCGGALACPPQGGMQC
jgi:hypothetical protein